MSRQESYYPGMDKKRRDHDNEEQQDRKKAKQEDETVLCDYCGCDVRPAGSEQRRFFRWTAWRKWETFWFCKTCHYEISLLSQERLDGVGLFLMKRHGKFPYKHAESSSCSASACALAPVPAPGVPAPGAPVPAPGVPPSPTVSADSEAEPESADSEDDSNQRYQSIRLAMMYRHL